ncbi:MAG: aldo/keto reductase [Litorimonas sp.]
MTRCRLTPNLDISRIVYGLWRLTEDPAHTTALAHAKIEACLAQGITTLDQADIYGDYACEEALGDVFGTTPMLRDQVEIVTKCGIVAPVGRYADARVKYYDTSSAHINQSVETSLRLMKTDRIDLLLIHRPDPFMDPEDTGRALDALVESGKVKAVGVSNFKPHDMALLSSAMSQPLVTNQIEISLTASDSLTNGDLAYLQQHNIPAMAWSPLGGGTLFDVGHADLLARIRELAIEHGTDAAAIAFAWLLAHPAGIIPIVGTNALDRIQTISTALSIDMDRETWFELYSLGKGHEVP